MMTARESGKRKSVEKLWERIILESLQLEIKQLIKISAPLTVQNNHRLGIAFLAQRYQKVCHLIFDIIPKKSDDLSQIHFFAILNPCFLINLFTFATLEQSE